MPREPFDSSTEVMQIVLGEVRELRKESNATDRELREDVRCMREELAENSGRVLGLEFQVKEWIGSHNQVEAQVKALSNDFEAHKDAEVEWQNQAAKTLASLSSDVAQVLPIAKSHEKIVDQAKGAIRATKLLWGLAAAILGTGGFAGGFVISGGKSSASQPPPVYVQAPASATAHPPPYIVEEIVLENPPGLVDGGVSKTIKTGGRK